MVDLHLHTYYSLLDGLCKPDLLMDRCMELNRKAVAVTDHGSIAGLVEFDKAARKKGIKLIKGCEFYHDRGDGGMYHLVLLARNREGYEHLVRLNNLAYENFYKKPRINDEMLRQWGKGLIALTACIQGYFPQSIIKGSPDTQWLGALQGWCDKAYVEIQNHGILDEQTVIDWADGADHGMVVGTVDAHYLRAEHKKAHEMGLAISMNKGYGEFVFNGGGYSVRGESDIALPLYSLVNTHVVADMVEDYDMGYDIWQLPRQGFDVEHEKQELEFRLDDFLQSEYGFNRCTQEMADIYHRRLEYEFDVIEQNGFLTYFKLVSEICDFVDNMLKSVRGWGRGSAGGSLVAMLYGITKIDPIKYGLYFERFLNPSRISPPDIDLDFKPEDRVKVLEFMRNRYGKVYQIGTYSTLGTAEVIRSVSRAMNINTGLEDYVPMEAPVPTIASLMEKKEAFYDYVVEQGLEDFVDILCILEGSPKSASAHASGVVIDVNGEMPYRISKSGVNANVPVTAYDMYSLEDMKFVKFDILGVNTLSIIDNVVRRISENLYGAFAVDDIPLDDAKTFESFNSGNIMGVFQFDTAAYKDLIKRLVPKDFNELVDLNTLGRPGCLDSGMTDEYIERKWGRKIASPIHEKMSHLGHQNLPLFQEDMMRVASELAGFSMARADILRKAIGKKQKELFDELHDEFISGCADNAITIEDSQRIWDVLEKSVRYTWNLSHAVCYTLISYWCMFLSTHYPIEFFCEMLSSCEQVGDSAIRRRMVLSECRRRGISVVHPSINDSERGFAIYDNKILLGLSGIKYCGDKAINAIIEKRGAGPYISSVDLQARCGKQAVNSRTLEYLLRAGAFPAEHIPSRDDEIESIGYALSGRIIDQFPYNKMPRVGEVLSVDRRTTKKGDPMAFVEVDFQDGVQSVTVFPSVYGEIKETLKSGFVAGWVMMPDKDNCLSHLFDPQDVEGYVVEIPEDKADEFLSFYPSCESRPNVRAAGYDLAAVSMNEDMLQFIDENFGVVRIDHRRGHR